MYIYNHINFLTVYKVEIENWKEETLYLEIWVQFTDNMTNAMHLRHFMIDYQEFDNYLETIGLDPSKLWDQIPLESVRSSVFRLALHSYVSDFFSLVPTTQATTLV